MGTAGRRTFIKQIAIATSLISSKSFAMGKPTIQADSPSEFPTFISTWNHGLPAVNEAYSVLKSGGSVLDACERGVMLIEADPTNMSVGLGGLPDRDGVVTLDASIMDHDLRAGSVCFVQGITHPISVARMVMEKTPHIMLSGKGAEMFAVQNGIAQQPNSLTDAARKAWEAWCVEKKYQPIINIENHDTIGLLGIDAGGRMAGVCTTSGLAYKVHGRVGDSPIIGAGLYVDGEIGCATCTGLGEAAIRTSAAFLTVEHMRNGSTPQQACEKTIQRIKEKNPNYADFQIGILALNKNGSHGAHSLQRGFVFALHQGGVGKMLEASS
ncbi:MAG: N(4)-(beta-N-acetylglucosaminyl)-L-asparaginase [Ignavibacteria bacterium]|nr:N(4)-(beta-N-acetylglucosaminyl)-L-asparaginase [Ignavibacteria bacterium]